jgi:hypothetical protein
MKFDDLVGKTVPIKIPMIHETKFQEVIIRGVDYGGIWIESESMTQDMLNGSGASALKTPVFFIPYHAIKFAYYGSEKLALSEKAFGL